MASRAGRWLVSGALAAAMVTTSCGSTESRPPPTSAGAATSPGSGSPTASSIGTPTAAGSGGPAPSAPGHSGIPARPGHRWMPTPGEPWQWQLTQPVDTSVNVPVYDIDMFENSAAVVSSLHALGRHVICYVAV